MAFAGKIIIPCVINASKIMEKGLINLILLKLGDDAKQYYNVARKLCSYTRSVCLGFVDCKVVTLETPRYDGSSSKKVFCSCVWKGQQHDNIANIAIISQIAIWFTLNRYLIINDDEYLLRRRHDIKPNDYVMLDDRFLVCEKIIVLSDMFYRIVWNNGTAEDFFCGRSFLVLRKGLI